MWEAATSECAAITETSHFVQGRNHIMLRLRSVTNGESHYIFSLQNKTNKDKKLRTMVLSFVYSPTVGLSEHMSTFGKIVKLIFCHYIPVVLVPNRCLADITRPPEISVHGQ